MIHHGGDFTIYVNGKPIGSATGTATFAEPQSGTGEVLLPRVYRTTIQMQGPRARQFWRKLQPTPRTKKLMSRMRRWVRRELVRLAGEVGVAPETKRAKAQQIVKEFKKVRVPRSLRMIHEGAAASITGIDKDTPGSVVSKARLRARNADAQAPSVTRNTRW